jgi:cytochrome c2
MRIFALTVTTFLFFVLQSCQKNPEKLKVIDDSSIQQDAVAKALFDQKCQVCHNLGKTEKTIIAPPFYAVRMMYMKSSMDKADFVSTMTDYVNQPDSTKSMMKPAVKRFGVMPKQAFKPEELALIIDYLYRTEMIKPDWFDTHAAMHRKGLKH